MPFFPTQVIVGLDGTPESRRALEVAVELCTATSSPLHLLHVRLTSGTLHGRPMTPRQREVADAEGGRMLAQEAQAAAELGLDVAGTYLRYGDQLARAMTEAADELGAGLLVIGESSTGRLATSLTSTYSASSTVRRSRGSVLVVR